MVADESLSSLGHVPITVNGHSGESGKGGRQKGAAGRTTHVRVPVGTAVYCEDDLVADLTVDGQMFCAVKGGEPGRGNAGGVYAIVLCCLLAIRPI